MKVDDLESWAEFLGKVEELEELHRSQRAKAGYVSSVLFRGHANARWSLKTTYERSAPSKLGLTDYYQVASRIRHEAETFTGTQWDALTAEEYRSWAESTEMRPGEYPSYEYLVWLRHHGFPSPLLDWSRSAYIAAHFAFAYPEIEAERVAVYAFLEYFQSAKGWSSTEPHIMGLGPYTRGHRRHFLQQCEYTICVVRAGHWKYASHEDVFAKNVEGQDLLWKFTLPVSERRVALSHLEKLNITGYSLFGSDESLFRTLAAREFLIKP